jgi:hypothetical protein
LAASVPYRLGAEQVERLRFGNTLVAIRFAVPEDERRFLEGLAFLLQLVGQQRVSHALADFTATVRASREFLARRGASASRKWTSLPSRIAKQSLCVLRS